MDTYLQITGMVLLSVIVSISLDGHAKISASVLIMTVCAMAMMVGIPYLRQILEFMHSVFALTGLQDTVLSPLVKSLGIGILSEITVRICADAGYGSLGKTIQFVANILIVCISLPLFQALMELLQKMMEAI